MRQEHDPGSALAQIVERRQSGADAGIVSHPAVLSPQRDVEVDADQGGFTAPVHVADRAEAHSLLVTLAVVDAAESRSCTRGFFHHMPGSPTISFRIEPFAEVRPLMCRATKAVMSDSRQA